MAFKLYTNKSSVLKKYSRYVQGGTTTVGQQFLKWWEKFNFSTDDVTDIEYTIPKVYAYKPDLIAYDYFGREDLAWLVLQYNNIVDINLELSTGSVIKLPSLERVYYQILTQPTP